MSAHEVETIDGLTQLVREAAAESKADIVLQALHVACGASALDAVKRAAGDERPIDLARRP